MSLQEYGVKKRWIVWGVMGLLVAIAIGFTARYFFGILGNDIDREVVQHSQSYVETKTSLLLSLRSDYEMASEPGMKIAIKNRICAESGFIPESQYPSSIRSFVSAHCEGP